MIEKDTQLMMHTPSSLISDDYYFKYIFKKTEKIVCAVFYILRKQTDISHNDALVSDLENTAQQTLETVLRSLMSDVAHSENNLKSISIKLIELESKLRVMHAAGNIYTEHLDVFVAEIDNVLRSVRSYVEKVNTVSGGTNTQHTRKKQSLRTSFEGTSGRSVLGSARASRESESGSRKERIRAVLRAQTEASIKDISDTIKDCSEKTLQRELNAMIKDGLVIREGQRRWSKYSLV